MTKSLALTLCCAGALVLVVAVAIINGVIVWSASPYVFHSLDDVPARYAALVLGAKVYKNGNVSPVLQDRLDAGAELWLSDAVQKLLLSGDHRTIRNDEPNAMKRYVTGKYPGISASDIFLDHAGFDTYDSVYRARSVFQADALIIVTQNFHAYRAVYLARALNIDAVALAVPETRYSIWNQFYWNAREVLARIKAFFDVLFNSKPALLGKPIPIQSDGRASWDYRD